MLFLPDNDLTIGGIDTNHIERFRPRKAQATTLADRVSIGPLMTTEDPAVDVHDITVHRPGTTLLFEKAHVIAVRNEADILAFRFFSDL